MTKRTILFSIFIIILLAGCWGTPETVKGGVGNEGQLRIICKPGNAEVYIDGALTQNKAKKYEDTPLLLRSGTHKVEIRRKGYEPFYQEIYVSNGVLDTISVTLRKLP